MKRVGILLGQSFLFHILAAAPFQPRYTEWDGHNCSLPDFAIEKKIGRGYHSTVYAAVNTKLHRRAALKVIPFSKDPIHEDNSAAIQNEEQILQLLSTKHSFVPTFYCTMANSTHAILAMELLEPAYTLDSLIRSKGVDISLATIFNQLVTIFSTLHFDLSISFCDLKAKNVMIVERDGNREVKLIDFGLAQPNVTEKSIQNDWYDMGIILHYMATGTDPHSKHRGQQAYRYRISYDCPSKLKKTGLCQIFLMLTGTGQKVARITLTKDSIKELYIKTDVA